MKIRLNKYLSEAGICSRREADRRVEAGRVKVDGQKAVVGMQVEEGQMVTLDGKKVQGASENRTILLAVHKPRGVVCSNVSQREEVNIIEYLNYPERITYAGRLDKDSEGLLLMTNRGDIIHQMMKGSHGHEKEYEVVVDRPVTDRFLRAMASGVDLPELKVRTRPCQVERMGERTFRIILTQGLNRQIRRMCKEQGYRVQKLTRVRILNIRLGHLKAGAYRKVTEEEMKELMFFLGHKKEPAASEKELGALITSKRQPAAPKKELGALKKQAERRRRG